MTFFVVWLLKTEGFFDHIQQCSQKSTSYGKTRYRLPMKIEFFDTFRILKERGLFWSAMDRTPKKWDAYAGIGISRAKNRVFFILEHFHCDRGALFCGVIAKNWGFFGHTMQCSQKSTSYGKTRYRLPMKIEFFDTFRILEAYIMLAAETSYLEHSIA